MMERCACGRPLHYPNEESRAFISATNRIYGETITVVEAESGREFLFQRHYIALHGLKGGEIAEVAQRFGFQEIQ